MERSRKKTKEKYKNKNGVPTMAVIQKRRDGEHEEHRGTLGTKQTEREKERWTSTYEGGKNNKRKTMTGNN